MDTAESQANGHTSVVLCCAPLQTCRAGPHCSPQSWGRMLPSSCCGRHSSQEAVAKDSSMLWFWGCLWSAEQHRLTLSHQSIPPCHAAQPHQRAPQAGCIPWECPCCSCPAQDGSTAQASPRTASRGPCPRLWEAPPSNQTLC